MKLIFVLALMAAFAASMFLLPSSGGPAANAAPIFGTPGIDFVDGQLIVKFAPGTPGSEQAAAHRAAGGTVIAGISSLGVQLVDVGPGRVEAALAGYSHNPNVAYAETNRLFHASETCTPDGSPDPCFSREWGLNNTGQNYGKGTGTADVDVDAKEAWDNGYLGTGIVVAVLDTGIDTQHPGLSGKVNCQGNPSPCRDFTGTSIDDLYGHGTWTASLVASGLGDGGIVGAAPGAGLMIGKVLNNSGSGSLFDIAAGIDWAVAGGADIISMSLGGSCPKAPVFGCNTLQTAVNNAWNAGVLLFAAAGNGGSNSTEYPGAFSNVIAVSAIDANNQLASFTDKGEIAAPGVNVFGAFPHCGGAHFVLQDSPYNKACDYDYGNGTSASTPIAAGVGALVMGEGGLSNAAVRDLLFQTADEVPGTKDGAGRVNACKALGLSGCGNLSPEVAITSPANGAAFPSGASIGFAGTAVDTEDGVLTTDLSWTSNLDGAIGSGGSFVKVLSDGTHTIVTSVSDGAGAVGSATIVVTVGSSGDGGGSGGPPCSKNSRPGCDPNK